MYILGISALYHDSAAALLHDGELIAAAQEERFSRIKFDHRFQRPHWLLPKRGKNHIQGLDYIVFYEKPLNKFERILQSYLFTFPHSWQVFRESMIAWLSEKLWLKSVIMTKLRCHRNESCFVDHHLSHAASAMFCSPFKEAACWHDGLVNGQPQPWVAPQLIGVMVYQPHQIWPRRFVFLIP